MVLGLLHVWTYEWLRLCLKKEALRRLLQLAGCGGGPAVAKVIFAGSLTTAYGYCAFVCYAAASRHEVLVGRAAGV